MSKKAEIKYNGYLICKADFDRLHQLDTAETKLEHRLDLAIKTLAELKLTDTQNVKLTQRYIDTTYPNAIKNIIQKRNDILAKYRKRNYIPEKLKQIIFTVAFVSIALTVTVLSILSIKNAAGF